MYHDTQGELGTWSKVERMGLATLCHVLGGEKINLTGSGPRFLMESFPYTAHMRMQTDQQFYSWVLSHVR